MQIERQGEGSLDSRAPTVSLGEEGSRDVRGMRGHDTAREERKSLGSVDSEGR